MVPRVGTIGWLGAWALLGGTGLLLCLTLTNPVVIGPVGVTVWFVGLLSVLTAVLTLVLYVFKGYFHIHDNSAPRLRYSLRQGLLLAGWVTGLLALSSLGQLGWRDVILLGIAGGIIELYVRFRWP